MDRYTSTYRRDYTWPEVSCVRKPPPPQIAKREDARGIACVCMDPRKALEELLRICRKSYDCDGRPERPSKLHTVKDKQRSKPLAARCPDPCRKSRDEGSARVNADRLKTTYQVDYSDPAAARMTRRDKPSAVVEGDGQQLQCCLPINIIIQADFPPHRHPKISKIGKSPRGKACDFSQKSISRYEKKHEDDDKCLSLWKSKYRDSIDRMDHTIIKAELHDVKRNVVPMYITTN
ncbi:uncharacterized protein LOC109504691 [Harpegnathos saltator]|uniref:Uncharacterized protein n=1 Tax=Harpegnathos saltator TaxID=610380 RepID=E2B802_HARSA|nr:uncharacterized protein LOC109504691 [Harpegnathos saltator]EFN88187.1 hypothetical protein EAI_17251 [Harpegnathos saltator]